MLMAAGGRLHTCFAALPPSGRSISISTTCGSITEPGSTRAAETPGQQQLSVPAWLMESVERCAQSSAGDMALHGTQLEGFQCHLSAAGYAGTKVPVVCAVCGFYAVLCGQQYVP